MVKFSETRTRFLLRKLSWMGLNVSGNNLRETFPHLSDREVAQALSYHTNGMPDWLQSAYAVCDVETKEVIDWFPTWEEVLELHSSLTQEEKESVEFYRYENAD